MKILSLKTLKLITFGLLIFSSLFLVQCKKESSKENLSKENYSSSGFSKITGYIHNRNVYPNTKDITIELSHLSGEERIVQIVSPINDDGTFSFEIDLARPQDARMPPYLDYLYLLPNDSLHIEIDFKNLSSIHQLSGGRSAELNHDFTKYFEATAYRTDSPFGYGKVGTDCEINCSWAEIRRKLDEDRNLFRERREAFLQKNSVSDEVKFITEAMIELDYYSSLLRIMQMRERHYGKETEDKESMMNEVNEIALKYFDTNLYSNVHFRFILNAYARAAALLTPIDTDRSEWIEKVSKTDTIKDFLFSMEAGRALLKKDLEAFEKFSEHVNNEYLLDRLMQEYRTTRANMLNPEGVSSGILGNPRKDLLSGILLNGDNILAKTIAPNNGKVQVINITTTWCAPCKKVVEQTKALKEEYAGEEISFSFICTNKDTQETREWYRLRGINDSFIHFTTEDEFYFLMKTFSPFSFPYGILVNKKGVIVDYGPHVRPGQMLQDKIDLLLKQDNLIK
ncbi:redoxin family protein [Bacteroidales bacterium OttesenSCG-928-A17]|nr:redoxin family protein [Bacteroidales bacterium OttesenSCG-928-A17]